MPPRATFEARSAAFLAHPGLGSAVADHCRAMIAPDPEGWPAAKLINQFGRYMVGFLLIHHYQHWRYHGGPPATLRRVRESSRLSPRQTASLVTGLRAGKWVAAEPVEGLRSRVLVPAPALTAAIARSMLAFVRASDALETPAAPRAARLAADPVLQNELIYRSAEYVFAHGNLLDSHPRVRHFTLRDCGYLVLAAVIAAACGPVGTAPSLSYASLAGRFRVSRSHVGNLMAEARDKQWFATDGRGGLAFVDPGLVDEFARWAAAELGHYSVIADAVLGGAGGFVLARRGSSGTELSGV